MGAAEKLLVRLLEHFTCATGRSQTAIAARREKRAQTLKIAYFCKLVANTAPRFECSQINCTIWQIPFIFSRLGATLCALHAPLAWLSAKGESNCTTSMHKMSAHIRPKTTKKARNHVFQPDTTLANANEIFVLIQ